MKGCKSDEEKEEGLRIFNEAQTNLMKLLVETRWEPAGVEFNCDFLENEFEGLEDAEQVNDWLRNGVHMGIVAKLVEDKAKQSFKDHSCFLNHEVILN